MNNRFLFSLAIMACIVLNASAQFSNSGSSNTTVSDNKGWTSLYLQYNNIGVSHDKITDSDYKEMGLSETMNGVTLGVNQAFNIVPSIPLYLEAGLGVQFALYSDNYSNYYGQDYYGQDYDLKYDYKGHILSAKVPLNILYRYSIPNTSIAIEPLLGIDLRINILGKLKENRTLYVDGVKEKAQDSEINPFKKDDMNNEPLKRFQTGWHIGANVAFNKVFLGLQYGSDFSKIHDDVYNPKLRTFTVSLGTRF